VLKDVFKREDGQAGRVDVRVGSPRAGIWAPEHGIQTLRERRGGARLHRTDLPELRSDPKGQGSLQFR
jgi:hypothetical protein